MSLLELYPQYDKKKKKAARSIMHKKIRSVLLVRLLAVIWDDDMDRETGAKIECGLAFSYLPYGDAYARIIRHLVTFGCASIYEMLGETGRFFVY